MDRRHFSAEVKRLAWARCQGHCEHCTAPIAAGGFQYDHDIAWEISRNSSLENARVLCTACHRHKSINHDLPAIVRGRHVSDFHHGISVPGTGEARMPCGRMSVHRKTIKGRVTTRQSQSELHRRAMAARYGGYR